MKVIVTIVLLLTSNLLGFTQDSNERKQLFDYDWRFFLGDTAAAGAKGFNDKSWRSLDLPHDWSIEGKTHPKKSNR